MLLNHFKTEPSSWLGPGVTFFQWGAALCSIVLAAFSYLSSSYEDLVILTLLQGLVASALIVSATKEIFSVRVPGKLLLVASTVLFFWLEAIEACFNDPPFAVPESFLSLWGQFPPELLRQAFLYIAIFNLMLLAGYSISVQWMRPIFFWISHRLDVSSDERRVVRYGLACCAFVPLLISYGFGIGETVESLIASRSKEVPTVVDPGMFQYLTFVGMYGSSLLLTKGLLDRSRQRIWPLSIGIVAALPFIMGGARHLWLFIALPACAIFMIRFHGTMRPIVAVRWIVGVFLFLLVVQLQFTIRTRGWAEIEKVEMSDLLPENATGQFVALLFAQHIVPELHDYFMEAAEPYFIYHWIPRQFWPDKPIMRSWEFYNAAYTRGGGFNVTPSVIGQFHMNWGVYGVLFIGLWLGVLGRVADQMLLVVEFERQQAMAVAIGMFYAFIVASFRFYSPVYFTYFVFAVAGMLILTRSISSPNAMLVTA